MLWHAKAEGRGSANIHPRDLLIRSVVVRDQLSNDLPALSDSKTEMVEGIIGLQIVDGLNVIRVVFRSQHASLYQLDKIAGGSLKGGALEGRALS